MSIFIDTGDLEHVEAAMNLGWVSGVTTNPLLMAQAAHAPQELLARLKATTGGPIFYQLVSENFQDMLAEAHQAQGLLENQLVVKLPPTDLGFKVCSELSTRMSCCPTAIYSPAQALVARESGAQYLAVYVNRATRLIGDGLNLVSEIARVLDGSTTTLLAASLKSPAEAMAAYLAGAHHLTLPHETLMAMSKQPLSEAAVQDFQANGAGL